ncbi:MAG TPA: hypothetical protein PK530_09160 [Anaerolineales bacterium]|nr:hypothetical protein [Anaerolineales bacterium]
MSSAVEGCGARANCRFVDTLRLRVSTSHSLRSTLRSGCLLR